MSFDVFISYARGDKRLRDALAEHLSGLRNDGTINAWFDGDIVEGTEWEPELFAHLNTAQIILLLISPKFLASDFSYQVEMKRALARHDAGEARVIPIILRPSDWKNAPFAKLQALPTDAKPVTIWSNRDEAFVSIVKGIKRAIRDLENRAAHTATTTPPPSDKSPDNQHRPATGPSTSTVHNHIGSISGSQHTIVQTGTQHITAHHYYDSSHNTRRVSPPRKKRASSNEGN